MRAVDYVRDFDGISCDPIHQNERKRRQKQLARAFDPSYSAAVRKLRKRRRGLIDGPRHALSSLDTVSPNIVDDVRKVVGSGR